MISSMRKYNQINTHDQSVTTTHDQKQMRYLYLYKGILDRVYSMCKNYILACIRLSSLSKQQKFLAPLQIDEDYKVINHLVTIANQRGS